MVELTIIVPVYNAEKEISLCLDSILHQINVSVEIIVVNDCSTDNTLSIIRKYQKLYSNITILNTKTNSGPGIARNLGLSYVTGSYVGFVDSDDWVDLNFYNTLLQAIKRDDSDIAIAGITDEYNNSLTASMRYLYEDYGTIDGKTGLKLLTKSYNLGMFITPIMNNKIYKTSFITDNKIYCSDNTSWQDDFFSFFAILYAKKICFVPKVQYHYKQRISSITHEATSPKIKIDNCINVLIKIRKELQKQKLYDIYEKDYYSFVERCITSLLSMLRKSYNSCTNENLLYLFEKITQNFSMKKIILYLDNERIYKFFNL